MSDYQP